MDCSTIISEARDHFPQLSMWVEACYGAASNPTFGEAVLQSMRGVKQGDPLGPPLFALLLQPILKELQEVEGLFLNIWYLDDRTLCGTRAALQEAWDLLSTRGPACGLEEVLGSPLSNDQWEEASLPMAFEGFGLRGAERHGAATYVASVTASQELVRVMLGTEPAPEAPELEELDGSQDNALQEDANLLAQLPIANALANLNSQLRVRLLLEQALSHTQRELSLVVDNEVRAALLGRTVNTRDQAEPQCLAREGAGDWLRALPCKALRLHLAKQEFVFMVKYCVGLPQTLLLVPPCFE